MRDQAPRFESWGILEIMGHSRFAGLIRSEAVGGVNMVRIDVPEIPGDKTHDVRPAFTKYFTQQAIFCLTPTTEETARAAAQSFRTAALNYFELPNRRLPYAGDDDFDDEP